MAKTRKERGKLFVISGPSGAGKGTITKQIRTDMGIGISVSMTTRAPREGEVHGKDYFFVTVDEFKENIANGNMLEYAVVFGQNMYGTPKDAVISRLERGHDVILEIDVQGALKVKAVMPEAVLIFILPPSLTILRERLTARGTDSEESIERRSREALNEIKLVGEYDYCVVNDVLEDALNETKAIIVAEGRRVPDKVKPLIRMYEDEI